MCQRQLPRYEIDTIEPADYLLADDTMPTDAEIEEAFDPDEEPPYHCPSCYDFGCNNCR